jgi:hypothetical protein
MDLAIKLDIYSVRVDSNSKLFSESRIISDKIFVNFATSVMGSIVELSVNKIKCPKIP